MDARKNFAYGTVATPPAPALSGTTLGLTTGHGTRFPTTGDGAYYAVVWPEATIPLASNAEIIRVSARSTDTLSPIARAQSSSSARSIVAGDQIALVVLDSWFDDLEALIAAAIVAAEAYSDGALATHTADTTAVHGIANTGALESTTGAQAKADAAQAAAIAASQPLDADLTSIAALSTTAYGRAFLALADAVAARSAIGSVIGTDVEAHDADLTTIAGLSASNDDVLQRKAGAWANRTIAQLATDLGLAASYQPLDSDLTSIAALATTSFGRSVLTQIDAAALRTLAGLVIGTNVQAFDADLTLLAALTASVTNGVIYWNGSAWVNAKIVAANITAATITDAEIAAANKDGAAGTASMRTLGTGAAQAASGTDARLSDKRTPVDGTVTDGVMVWNGSAWSSAKAVDANIASGASIAQSKIANLTSDLALKAPFASPALTGSPTAPTQSAADNSTKIGTTAYVDTACGLLIPKNLVTTKGDLVGASGSSTPVRVAVGANDSMLVADSSQSSGVAWKRKTRYQETTEGWLRSGCFAENYPRHLLTNTDIVIATTGVLYLFAGPKLYAGDLVSAFSVLVNGGSAALTHSWFALVDQSRNVLCKTADDTGAWATGERTVSMGTPFSIAADVTPYIGLVITAGTMPTLRGISTWATAKTLAPRLTLFSETGLTTPATLGGTAPTTTTDFGSGLPWCGLS